MGSGVQSPKIMIPESHPLQKLFVELIGRHYAEEIGIRDPQIVNYVAHLMAEFCEVEQLFKIRNGADQPITDVGEMLMESNPVYGPAPSFDRERQVRKHIGDYTLFFAGMFPESINHFRLRRNRTENFIDWIKAGKESYYIVSKFEHFEYTKVAPLFANLSSHFEQCVYGLNQVGTICRRCNIRLCVAQTKNSDVATLGLPTPRATAASRQASRRGTSPGQARPQNQPGTGLLC